MLSQITYGEYALILTRLDVKGAYKIESGRSKTLLAICQVISEAAP